MAAVDLSTFKPADAEELGDAILAQVGLVVTSSLKEFKAEIEPIVRSIAQKGFKTAELLAAGHISREDADLALHTQELALANVVLYSQFMTYVLAQDVRDAVFKVIVAAINNLTGVELAF